MTSSVYSAELTDYLSKYDAEEGISQAKAAMQQVHDNEVGGLLLGLVAPTAPKIVGKLTDLYKGLKQINEARVKTRGAPEETTTGPQEGDLVAPDFESEPLPSGGNPTFDPDAAPESSDVFEPEAPVDLSTATAEELDAGDGDLSGVSDEALSAMQSLLEGKIPENLNALSESEFNLASQARASAEQAGQTFEHAAPGDELYGGMTGDSTLARAGVVDRSAGESEPGDSSALDLPEDNGVTEAPEEFARVTGEAEDLQANASSAVESLGETAEGLTSTAEGLTSTAGEAAGLLGGEVSADSLLAAGLTLDAIPGADIVGGVVTAAAIGVSLYEGVKDIFGSHSTPTANVSLPVFEPGSVSQLG